MTYSTLRRYGTDYALEKIDAATLDTWKDAAPHPSLSLPSPNRYIPTDLHVATPGAERNGHVESDGFGERREASGAEERSGHVDSNGAAAPGVRTPSRLLNAEDEARLGTRVWHVDAGRHVGRCVRRSKSVSRSE